MSEALIGAGVFFVMVLIAGAVLFTLAFMFTFFSGTYGYEYRCTENVVERRLEWWGGIPIGGFDPVDGDPVGGCP